MLIGKHYNKKEYNCAHYVAEWYKERLDVSIVVENEFERSFLMWMRRHFADVKKPEDHCLVMMKQLDGSYHIGVYHNYRVHHNFKPVGGKGAVCSWTLGSIKSYYTEVSYHKWSKLDTLSHQRAANLKPIG